MGYYTVYSDELYHYGVLGMKWGVRRSPEQLARASARRVEKAEAYKKREVGKIAKRRLKEVEREGKQIDKQAKKYDEALDKYGQSSKTYRQAANYINTKANAIRKDEIAKAEVKKLMSMDVKDVKAERLVVGQAYAKSALLTVGSKAVAMAVGSPISIVSIPNVKNVKTNHRVSSVERATIYTNAIKEASADVYGKRN